MKTIQLDNKRDFPLTTNALKYIQEAYGDFEQLAKLGGDNYILSGGVVTGTAASSGWVVIAGRLMPFLGGTIQSNVRVVATSTVITVGRGTREHTVYTAEFGTSANPAENIGWDVLNSSRLSTLLTLKSLASELSSAVSLLNQNLAGTKRLVIEIGSWNMDSLATKDIDIPTITAEKVISISAVIIDDSQYGVYNIDFNDPTGNGVAGQVHATRTNPDPMLKAKLKRFENCFFDSVFFGSTSVNRGFVYVIYID